MRMMKSAEYLLIFALIGLLLAVGCSKTQETVVPEKTDTQAATAGSVTSTQTEATAGTAQVSYELSADEKKKVEDNIRTNKVYLSTPYKIMSIGDVYVFALGVKNIMPQKQNFRIKMRINDAKSTSGGMSNLVTTDDTIYDWTGRNRFGVISLANAEETIVPIIMEVGPKVSATQDTLPGTYTFEVIVEYESTPQFWDRYDAAAHLLAIKVK